MIDHVDPDYGTSAYMLSPDELPIDNCNDSSFDPSKMFREEHINATFVSYSIKYHKNGKDYYSNDYMSGCYGGLRGSGSDAFDNPKKFTTAIRYRSDVDVNPLLDYIFDKKISPYKKLLEQYNYGLVKAEGGQAPYFFVDLDEKTSSQLVMSLAMAARLGMDSPAGVRLFNKLLECGLSQPEALYIALYLGINKKGDIITHVGYDLYGFSARNTNNFVWLRDGTPRLNSSTFSSGYSNLQKMWLKDEKPSRNGVPSASIYKILNMNGEYKGIFPKGYKNSNGGNNSIALSKNITVEEILSKKDLIIKAGS